ncbi:MAG: polysaccharide pyruvyl transferase family protein [Lachnoclostridium sp.]|nr:polysaccharide pyruvyl transferase family protein [Lachnospira sp.]MCM1247212.1 polysaccharide pyruvyl transferase family protein [Lachnoclostridium sp.]MCM1534567.1 polysaccharide pyruvyl transferase family protein [Clostridium sp.]
MRIGILTLFHGNDNWGGTLQGAALKMLLETCYPSAQVDLIDYRSNENIIYPTIVKQAMQYGPYEILRKGVDIAGRKIKNPLGGRLKNRKRLFREFREQYTTNRHIYTDDAFEELERDYDCLICGSDQIWNPNVAKAGYFLKGVEGSCRKISYAASIARDDLSPHERKVMIPLINEFDVISVREHTAKKILEKYLTHGKKVYEVLDPALMLSKEEWLRIAGKKMQEQDKYAIAFFFSDSLRYRKEIEKYCYRKGLKLKFIPFAAEKYIRNDEKGNCEHIYDIGPAEFIQLFSGADCIFTDSFHGIVFSLLFEKSFCVFERDTNTRVSKNSRIRDILNKFKLEERLICDMTKMTFIMDKPVDYKEVNSLLGQYRRESLLFLKQAVSVGQTEVSDRSKQPDRGGRPVGRIDSLTKEECCGCGLCADICPKNCIKLIADDEGFFYPAINEEQCIHCGLCQKVCKEKNINFKGEYAHAYIGYNKDESIRLNSSSGGLFFELARAVIQSGGVVYGVSFTENFSAACRSVETEEELFSLMTSKYVQSDPNIPYETLIKELRSGRKVLFSGTPCQTAAVAELAARRGLRSNLYLIDVICHGVPSPGVWQSYLDYVKKDKQIKSVSFRDKKNSGWYDYYLRIKYADDSEMRESHALNAYMRTFLSDGNLRLSCYHCPFKGENYASDITLGDAWKIEKEFYKWADDKGTSLFIVHTKKGEELQAQIRSTFVSRKTDYDRWRMMNPALEHSASYPIFRNSFFRKYKTMPPDKFWKEEKLVPQMIKLRYVIKKTLKILHADKLIRRYG